MINLIKIQNWLKKNSKDVLIVNRTDEFLSEYIAPYAERLNWVSNFSGSAGRAIIEKNQAYIFIDGRYTNQVTEQVDSNYFTIKHLNLYWSHLEDYKKKNKKIILDPSLHSIKEVERMQTLFKHSNVCLEFIDKNPIDINWQNQPIHPTSKAFIHEEKYSGKSSKKKIKKIQEILKKEVIDYYLLSSLDSIAWLLNIRGRDIEHTPLLFCFAIISCKGKINLFVDKKKIESIKNYLKPLVNIYFFDEIDQYLERLDAKKIIGMDENQTSYRFKKNCDKIKLKIKIYNNPCILSKAVKNSVELNGARNANVRDGISICKFLFRLKNLTILNKINEIKASDYLYNLRKNNKFFYSLSFDTISAFGPHASLPHYRVTKNSNLTFKNDSIYLIDSGGQYYDGTTDITRTIVIGTPTNIQKDRFTRVLKGHIAIAKAIFKKNTKGSELDSLARKSLKEIGCDYDHGTGHGIGSFLSVHEGPQRIAKSQGQSDGFIKKGMILSNEPGYYEEGKYGIRIENLIICCSKNTDLLYFETISFAPIDKDLIDTSILEDGEKEWINQYHQKVYDIISPNLNTQERKWLYQVSRPIK